MEAQCAVVVVEGRVEFVRPMDPAPIDHHHDFLPSFPEGCHHLVHILAQLLRIKVREDFREDFGGPILHRANDTEPHATRDPAPGARAEPRLAVAGCVTFEVTLAHWARGETRTRRCTPPARAGQGKAPEDGFVFIPHNDCALASPIRQRGECERGIGEGGGVGSKATSGTRVADLLFLKTPRTLSRPSWTPVCWASPVARSRQRHGEWREPCGRGS